MQIDAAPLLGHLLQCVLVQADTGQFDGITRAHPNRRARLQGLGIEPAGSNADAVAARFQWRSLAPVGSSGRVVDRQGHGGNHPIVGDQQRVDRGVTDWLATRDLAALLGSLTIAPLRIQSYPYPRQRSRRWPNKVAA